MDEGELGQFMGDVLARLKGLEVANVRQGERLGGIEERLRVVEQRNNGWRTKGLYAGGGGLSIVGLIELFKSLIGN